MLFVEAEAYKVGCEVDETPSLFAGSDHRQPARWTNPFLHTGIRGALLHQITADSARPETISYMTARGFSIRPATKGPGSVEDGIEFLKSHDIFIHPRCRHLIDEMAIYSWATDRLTGEILSKLSDRDNHVIDALRYALEGARKASKPDYSFASSGPRVAAQMRGFQLGGRRSGQPDCAGGNAVSMIRRSPLIISLLNRDGQQPAAMLR